jgi:hypothetical protein
MDWLTFVERLGFPIAMAIWLLVEGKNSRRSLEAREARYQAESAQREAEAATKCTQREADMTKRIRELEESRMTELKAANDQYLGALQSVSASLQDFASQCTDYNRAVRHLYQHLKSTCARAAADPPGGVDTSALYRPVAQVAEIAPPEPQQVPQPQPPTRRRSSPEIRVAPHEAKQLGENSHPRRRATGQEPQS